MSKTIKAFFTENFPGMTVEEACQSILDELDDIESKTGIDTGTFKLLVEAMLDDAHDTFSSDEDDDA